MLDRNSVLPPLWLLSEVPRAYGGHGDLSSGMEDAIPDNHISGGPPFRYELVHTDTSKKGRKTEGYLL